MPLEKTGPLISFKAVQYRVTPPRAEPEPAQLSEVQIIKPDEPSTALIDYPESAPEKEDFDI